MYDYVARIAENNESFIYYFNLRDTFSRELLFRAG